MRKYKAPNVTRSFKTTKFVAVNGVQDENGELVKSETEMVLIGEFTAEQCKSIAGTLAVKNVEVTEQLYGCSAEEFLKIAKPVTRSTPNN